ncbi:hypothetical protein ACFL1B_05955 [Nanoarchaeota archaeon]
MDVEAIVGRFVEKGHEEENIRATIESYLSMPLTLPVDDVPMRRISEVLTNHGYITTITCDGHGKKFPQIFLQTKDSSHLRHLAHIVAREITAANLPWRLIAWSYHPLTNTDIPLSHILEPYAARRDIDPQRDHAKLLQDLDIIGIYVMDYFSDIKPLSCQ